MSSQPLSESQFKKHKRKEHDPNYKGESLNEHYDVCNTGPKGRCCPTDIICCTLFIGFIAGMVILAIAGFSTGNPESILYPFDPDGNQCGITSGYEDYKYIYFASLTDASAFICVDKCPDGEESEVGCVANSKVKSTSTNVCSTSLTDPTNFVIYETQTIVYTCIPSTDAIVSTVSSSFPSNSQMYIADIDIAWKVELGGMFIALVIGYLYLVFMRYCTGCMTWVIIALFHVLLIVIGVFLYTTSLEDQYQTADQATMKTSLEWGAYSSWVFCFLVFLYVLCIRKRIAIAIAILKAATEFTREYLFVMFVPLIIFVVYLGALVFWLYGFLYVYTSGTPLTEVSFPYSGIDVDDTLRNAVIYFLIGLIWVSEWFVAYSFFVIAAMACIWYFQRLEVGGCSALSKSLCWGFVHTGSLAFGAAICTIVDIMKMFLYYLHKMVDKESGGSSAAAPVKCLLKCLICCAECFEAWLRYINKNAYIQIALTDTYFCKAAHNAFYLMFRNANLFIATDGIGMILIFVGKLFISLSSTFICYLIIQYSDLKDQVYSPIGPCAITFVVCYFIAYMLLNIYGVACDSLLQCYCLDSEAAGSEGRNKHTPETLKEFVDAHE